RIRFHKRTLGIAVLVAAVGSGELAVDEDDHGGFGRSWAARVTGENALAGGRNGARIGGAEEAQRHFDAAVLAAALGLQAERLTGQSVKQRTSEGGCGNGQELSAFHMSFSGCFR